MLGLGLSLTDRPTVLTDKSPGGADSALLFEDAYGILLEDGAGVLLLEA